MNQFRPSAAGKNLRARLDRAAWAWAWTISACILAAASPAAAAPTPPELDHAMGERISRVTEFAFIREQAEKLGVRAYLFGGSAASYAHYVRQDLQRESGDSQYQKSLFEYDYTQIMRSTQDLDLVIDGTAEQAEKLENTLRERFPHFLGTKANQWEVRPLRVPRRDKDAILGNPDFLNQHSDSHSTGLVEVTSPTNGGPVVHDVRDWGRFPPRFLTDVAAQKISYYWSPLHETTKRYREGKNPPILSAIRYLTKAFQYDLSFAEEDLARIRETVTWFDPKGEKDDYVKGWLEKHAQKLFLHAVNLERAAKTLESIGLRRKLVQIEALAALLDREPLPSFPLGSGDGKTAAEIAAELGLPELVVAHEARDFLAYESIIRSRAGELNALVSREGKTDSGEHAVYGKGFYTQLGRQGARNTGYTIRMRIPPEAREGTDFFRPEGTGYFVLANKRAARVVHESIELSMLAYFEQLASTRKGWDADDLALVEAFRRRTGRLGILNSDEAQAIKRLVETNLLEAKSNPALLLEWLLIPESAKDVPLARNILRKLSPKLSKNPTFAVTTRQTHRALESRHWLDIPGILPILQQEIEDPRFLADHLRRPTRLAHSSTLPFVREVLGQSTEAGKFLSWVLMSPEWRALPDWPQLWKSLLQSGHSLNEAAKPLSRMDFAPRNDGEREEMIRAVMATGRGDEGLRDLLHFPPDEVPIEGDHLFLTSLQLRREIVGRLVAGGNFDSNLAEYAFASPQIYNAPEFPNWFKTVLDRSGPDYSLAWRLRHLPSSVVEKFIEVFIKRGSEDAALARVLGTPELARLPKTPNWLRTLATRNSDALTRTLDYVLPNLDNGDSPVDWVRTPIGTELVELALRRGGKHSSDVAYLLRKGEWIRHPKAGQWLRTLLLRNDPHADNILYQRSVLEQPEWSHHPEIHALLRQYGSSIERVRYGMTIQEQIAGRLPPQVECVVNGVRYLLNVQFK